MTAYALTLAVAIFAAAEWLWIYRQLRRIKRSKNIMLRIMEG